MKVLVLDNYDSFVYNLAQYIGEIGEQPRVVRNDEISLAEVKSFDPDRIVISPGPGDPTDSKYFGVCADVLRNVSPAVPTLGVCLGHQGIGTAFGARIVPARRLMHGKTSMIQHDGRGLLAEIPNPFQATRYHSLALDKNSLPSSLRVTSVATDDDEIMGVRHAEYPIEGVQYHPESITTPYGKQIIRNFLLRGVEH